MKLTGKLKDKVDKAETKEEAKELIAQAGMELTDEELDSVAGGLAANHHVIKMYGETDRLLAGGNDQHLLWLNGWSVFVGGMPLAIETYLEA